LFIFKVTEFYTWLKTIKKTIKKNDCG